ncbi:uncharacterized protein BT62DRAFT_998451 [Guyanagaster necrorhizus]|uniref:Uncharacterized protein n=1 Tax=Guyanagaster necrorhizus TaxID=856835 RepID=A0A9P7W592_9AGAR|nr:uncharacterized protein BT62DRAFT_998451 [Guyanagaster necrorhizus MCA 3950]KAG7452414.1 hypothetical protein BT62DRAFT_998451 [Guyanagaster necrorhizus MCA 3950]
MPKVLTQRRDRRSAHPYLRPQLPSTRSFRRSAVANAVNPGFMTIAPANQAPARGGYPTLWFKVMAVAVVVAVVGHLADRVFCRRL